MVPHFYSHSGPQYRFKNPIHPGFSERQFRDLYPPTPNQVLRDKIVNHLPFLVFILPSFLIEGRLKKQSPGRFGVVRVEDGVSVRGWMGLLRICWQGPRPFNFPGQSVKTQGTPHSSTFKVHTALRKTTHLVPTLQNFCTESQNGGREKSGLILTFVLSATTYEAQWCAPRGRAEPRIHGP